MRANIRFAVAVLAGTVIATAGLWGPGAAGVGAQGGGAQGGNAVLNQPSYYEGLGYGTCTKTENPGDPYTLGQPPAGSHWSLLVLKAGSQASTPDWNTLVENPAPGPYVHPSGKNLSHVIVCSRTGAPTTPTTTPTTVPGGDCGDYTPTQVTVSPSSVLPGESFTISGTAVPGDTVTATLTGPGTAPVPLGSDEVDANGQFSITATAPESLQPGNYTITLSSTECPVDIEVTIVVLALTTSGCGNSRAVRTFSPGQTIGWEPQTASFITSQPIRMRLIGPGGFSAVLYDGPWPANNQITMTIPATAPVGQYTMEQRSTRVNGQVMTRTCPVWIQQSGVSGGSTQLAGSVPISDSRTAAPWAAAGLAAMAGLVLFRLRSRRTVQEA